MIILVVFCIPQILDAMRWKILRTEKKIYLMSTKTPTPPIMFLHILNINLRRYRSNTETNFKSLEKKVSCSQSQLTSFEYCIRKLFLFGLHTTANMTAEVPFLWTSRPFIVLYIFHRNLRLFQLNAEKEFECAEKVFRSTNRIDFTQEHHDTTKNCRYGYKNWIVRIFLWTSTNLYIQ